MIIEQATVLDAEEILKLQKLAYLSEVEIYNDYSIPPLTQTIKEIEVEFKDYIFLKASIDDGRINTLCSCTTFRTKCRSRSATAWNRGVA